MMFENGGTTDLSTAANNVAAMRNGVAMFRYLETRYVSADTGGESEYTVAC